MASNVIQKVVFGRAAKGVQCSAEPARGIAHDVGAALHVLRVARRMSQEDVARELGRVLGKRIRQSYVSKVEKGQSNISITRLDAISRVLQCTPSAVMSTAEAIARDVARPEKELLREALEEVLARMEKTDVVSGSGRRD